MSKDDEKLMRPWWAPEPADKLNPPQPPAPPESPTEAASAKPLVPGRTPEQQRRIDEFSAKIGPAMVEALNNLPHPNLDGPSSPPRAPGNQFIVRVQDNFHSPEDDSYEHGRYPTLEAAIAVCKGIVDDSLARQQKHRPGMTGAELYNHYKCGGDDPYIIGPSIRGGAVPFSAWSYAKERCADMDAPKPSPKTPPPPRVRTGFVIAYLGTIYLTLIAFAVAYSLAHWPAH